MYHIRSCRCDLLYHMVSVLNGLLIGIKMGSTKCDRLFSGTTRYRIRYAGKCDRLDHIWELWVAFHISNFWNFVERLVNLITPFTFTYI